MTDAGPIRLSQVDMDKIKQNFGTDQLYVDRQGNVRDKMTHQIVAHHKSVAEIQSEEKTHCQEYFRGLPVPVQNALLQASLTHLIEQALEQMHRYDIARKDNELWGLSYEELAKMTAEGILLNET